MTTAEALARRARDLADLVEAGVGDPARLVDAVRAVGDVVRLTEGVGVDLAGRVDALWDGDADRAAVRAIGQRSPQMVFQVVAGLSAAVAQTWVRVGSALRQEISLLGELLPSRHEPVAEALAAGGVGVATAARVLETAAQIEPFSSPVERAAVERYLIGLVPELTDRQFAVACAEVVVKFEPENQALRERFLEAKCGVTVRQRADEIVEIVIRARGVDAGLILAGMDAHTAPRRQVAMVPTDELPAEPDTRTLSERRLEAVVSAFRLSLAADDGKVAGSPVTMRVTMTLDALLSGLGTAKVDGLDHPISAREARRLAADAKVIPVVLGTGSVPLDLGREARLATPAQRDAVAIRDGGCIWGGCSAPPGRCEVAHIVPWADGGPTDLDNLMLLCPFHHRCFDLEEWELVMIGGDRYFIPPAWVDSARTPRRAGPRRAYAA